MGARPHLRERREPMSGKEQQTGRRGRAEVPPGRRRRRRAQAKKAAAEAQFTATLAGLEVAAARHGAPVPRVRGAPPRARPRGADPPRRPSDRGRAYVIQGGKVRSRAGLHPAPDLTMTLRLSRGRRPRHAPGRDYLEFIDALKNFQMRVEGPDDLAVWFSETLQMMLTAGLEFGVDMGDGVRRFTSNTNGGPVFVYVRGRAHPAHHADRVRRGRRRAVDDRGARAHGSRRRARRR